MAVRVVKNNYMPIYTVKCKKCGFSEEMFFGKVIEEGTLDKSCRKCGHQGLTKIPMPINNAKFSSSGSRRSVKTRTGVGELLMAKGSKKIVDDANK